MPTDSLTYRFALSDEEFGRAWLREYYRRPGWRAWRVIGGPCLVGLGIAMSTSAEALTRWVGIATIVLGLWTAVKPFIARRMLTKQRSVAGHSGVEIELRLDDEGIRIDDGRVRKQLDWAGIVRAGETADYFWYELRGGSRATIPTRVVDDPSRLRRMLGERTTFSANEVRRS